MASSIVHDIRNPLNTLYMASDTAMLSLKKIDSSDNDEAVSRVERSIKNMKKAMEVINHLADQLGNFSRGMAEQYEIVDLHTILTDALFLTESRMKKYNIRLDSQVEKQIHYTKGAYNQLQQVFVNLIANACDAMSEVKEGSLTLSITPCIRDERQFLRCDISDTGTGIPQEQLDSIFQSFFTTKEKGKGTGLGLSIARGIIKNHDGEIEVSSEPGKGTTFSVFLNRMTPE
jgi:signal transduction histidine kinase